MIPTAHPSTHSNGISIGSAVFAQGTAECPYTLQRDAPPPSKLPIPMGVSGPPSNTWFLVRTRVHNPNGISIGSAVFAGLTSVTDRQTDHATRSVTIGRIHVRSTAMRPNNNNGQSNLTRRPHCSSTWMVQSYRICQVRQRAPHLIHAIWTHASRHPNSISIDSVTSAHLTAESPDTLQWATPFSPQNCPFARGIWTPI